MVILPCGELWGAGGRLLTGWWAGCPPWRCTAVLSSALGNSCCWTDRCHLKTEPGRQTWPWRIHASDSSWGGSPVQRQPHQLWLVWSLSAPLLVTTTNPGRQVRPARMQPVLPAGQGCTEEGRGCWKPKRCHTRKRPVCCLSSVLGLCYPLGGRWPVIKGRRAGSGLLPESEGSAQLWTAGALSVCLSPSKSIPPHISLSLPPSLPLLSLPSDRCPHPRLSSGFLYENELR